MLFRTAHSERYPLSTLSVAFFPPLHPQTFPPRSKTSSPPPIPQTLFLHPYATTITLPQTLLLHPHASASPLLPLRSNPPLCSNHSHVSNKHTITHSEGNVLTSSWTQTNKITSLPSDLHRSTKTRTFPTVELQHRTHTPGVILGIVTDILKESSKGRGLLQSEPAYLIFPSQRGSSASW